MNNYTIVYSLLTKESEVIVAGELIKRGFGVNRFIYYNDNDDEVDYGRDVILNDDDKTIGTIYSISVSTNEENSGRIIDKIKDIDVSHFGFVVFSEDENYFMTSPGNIKKNTYDGQL